MLPRVASTACPASEPNLGQAALATPDRSHVLADEEITVSLKGK